MTADRFGKDYTSREPRILPDAPSLAADKAAKRSTVAFRALLVLSVLYYARPEDWIYPLRFIPMSKIAGGIALGALMFGVSGTRTVKKWPVELKVLMAMFAWLTFT
ncbi:MAG: hypothetical protein JOY93_05660, partial [Acidobacteriales bacterium]|nr:hypothetical protein [Terriglobales bacterium]